MTITHINFSNQRLQKCIFCMLFMRNSIEISLFSKLHLHTLPLWINFSYTITLPSREFTKSVTIHANFYSKQPFPTSYNNRLRHYPARAFIHHLKFSIYTCAFHIYFSQKDSCSPNWIFMLHPSPAKTTIHVNVSTKNTTFPQTLLQFFLFYNYKIVQHHQNPVF